MISIINRMLLTILNSREFWMDEDLGLNPKNDSSKSSTESKGKSKPLKRHYYDAGSHIAIFTQV